MNSTVAQTISNKPLLIWISIIFLFAVALLTKPTARVVNLETDVSFPISVGQLEPFSNHFISNNVLPKLKIVVDSTAPVIIKVGGKKKYCDDVICTFVVMLSRGRVPLKILSSTDAQIKNIQFQTVKYKNKTTLSVFPSQHWPIFVAGFLIILLLAGVSSKFSFINVSLIQWATTILVVTFIWKNDALFAVSLLVYLGLIHRLRFHINDGKKGALRLISFVVSAIAFLLVFKYAKPVIASIFANPGNFNLLMPIGVSYFVIRIIDTQLRWYRGQNLDLSFREFVFFIIFPGTLVAGPIENVGDFYKNKVTRMGRADYAYGLSRFLIGLFKKIVIADGYLFLAMHGGFDLWDASSVNEMIANPSIASGGDIFTFSVLALLFAYIDFSAYSDMAIGASRLLGYRICENFNFPILAENIREYWKRWHMSLSAWSFRNIYFPLLIKTQNSYLPLYVTMTSIGLWHAFSLSWFSWALHHATGMSVVALMQKKLKVNKRTLQLLRPVRIAATVLYASMGLTFVYFDDYTIALQLYLKYWQWILSIGIL